MSNAHTPTTADIVNAYTRDTDDFHFARAEFYRWLAAHEDYIIRKWTAENDVVPHKRYTQDVAAAEQRGAEKVLKDLADNHTVRIPDILGYKVQAVFTETIWEKLDEMNRADRLEGNDETHWPTR